VGKEGKSDNQSTPRRPSREQEAKQVAEEYAEVQRELIDKLRRKLDQGRLN